jgi:hypothetical protein
MIDLAHLRPATTELLGATVRTLDSDAAAAILAWLFDSNAGAPFADAEAARFEYALLQCADTLVWGVYEAGNWTWADEQPDSEVRQRRWEALQEARIFGPTMDILIWSAGGGFRGRLLTGAANSPGRESLRRFAAWDQADDPDWAEGTVGDAFCWRRTTGGRVTVTPRGTGVELLDYLSEDEETGVLRVAATRFVTVRR